MGPEIFEEGFADQELLVRCRVAAVSGRCDHRSIMSGPLGPDIWPDTLRMAYSPQRSNMSVVSNIFFVGNILL